MRRARFVRVRHEVCETLVHSDCGVPAALLPSSVTCGAARQAASASREAMSSGALPVCVAR